MTTQPTTLNGIRRDDLIAIRYSTPPTTHPADGDTVTIRLTNGEIVTARTITGSVMWHSSGSYLYQMAGPVLPCFRCDHLMAPENTVCGHCGTISTHQKRITDWQDDQHS